MTRPAAIILIPNYNGQKLLARYLPSVVRAARRAKAEVIVADDASSDDSVAWLKTHVPEVAVLVSGKNLGFAENCNRAIQAMNSDFVILLNSDVEVEENFIGPLLKHFESSSGLFAVSPHFYNQALGGRDEAVTYFHFKRGLIHVAWPCLAGADPPEQAAPVGYACGGAAAYDRRKFLELGGFDSLFAPYYWEDSDLSYRAWKRGWRVVFEPQSRVFHQHQGTISRLASDRRIRQIILERQLWFNWKNLTDPDLLFWNFILWPIRLLYYLVKPDRGPELRAMVTALARIGPCLRHRKQNLAQLTDREVLRRARPRIPVS